MSLISLKILWLLQINKNNNHIANRRDKVTNKTSVKKLHSNFEYFLTRRIQLYLNHKPKALKQKVQSPKKVRQSERSLLPLRAVYSTDVLINLHHLWL